MPTTLPAEAAAEWRRIAPELDRIGMLTKVDRAALTHYCLHHARAMWAETEIATYGGFIDVEIFGRYGNKIGTRRVVNPAIKISKEEAALVRQFLSEFGLTPGSRTRLKTPEQNHDDNDEVEAIIKASRNVRA